MRMLSGGLKSTDPSTRNSATMVESHQEGLVMEPASHSRTKGRLVVAKNYAPKEVEKGISG